MEKVARLITVGASVCFIVTAAYLFGYLVGLGHLELAAYLTLSDLVNHAFSTVWPILVLIILLLLFDRRMANAIKPAAETPTETATGTSQGRNWSWVWSVQIGVVAGLMSFSFQFALQHIPIFGYAVLVIITAAILISKGKSLAMAAGGVFAAAWLEIVISAISAAICGGLAIGAGAAEHKERVHKVDINGTWQDVDVVIPFDRGLVTLKGQAMTIFPWSEVKAISESPATPATTKK